MSVTGSRTSSNASETPPADQSTRETVESIIVAVILAFLFRGFVAEAFVIPTGSMAPTLQGRHMDVVCPECRYQYRTGASSENEDSGSVYGKVLSTRCPLCRYKLELDKIGDVNQRSFNGDRILVSKFAYQFQEPQRWDVIVFKYPGNAKINYIKRLVGLPGERLKIRHGDIHRLDPATRGEPEAKRSFEIVRKPPEKLLAMLQLVDDTRYVSPQLRKAGWPSRWVSAAPVAWRETEEGGFSCAAQQAPSWLRFRHLPPRDEDWYRLTQGQPLRLDDGFAGRLITDYYAYNESQQSFGDQDCWVGDLALECEVEVRKGSGELLLDLVEGGTHYRCSIAVATGLATLSIDDDAEEKSIREQPARGQRFLGVAENGAEKAAGKPVKAPVAMTPVRGPGIHRLRFANVDDQLLLWVDEKLMSFDGPTTYTSRVDVQPRWSADDPGDLQPLGIAARGLEVKVSRLRVLRDIYYRAVKLDRGADTEYAMESWQREDNFETVMSSPQTWSTTKLFASRRSVEFELGADQFFPLGDNSPQSKDARLWSNRVYDVMSSESRLEPEPHVKRELLIGRAIAIYWPHGWRYGTERVGFIPNFQRIGLIR